MGIPYNSLNCKNIVFLAGAMALSIILCVFSFSQAKASDSLFVVKGVKVDITAENSVRAQEQAFEKAQIKAFGILTKRMVEEAQIERVKQPALLTISTLIKDYEVTNEQLSSTRYIGTYIFRFREAEVSSFFSTLGVSFTAQSSKPLLILPVYQKDGEYMLWSEGNIWMQAWSHTELQRGIVPIEVPIGDLMDIADIDEAKALSYNRHALDRMLERYNAREAAIMIAVPDDELSSVSRDGRRASGNLRISIYRTDSAHAEHVKDITLEAGKNESISHIYERGVLKAHQALQLDWKNKTVTSAAQSQLYTVRVPFEDINEWVKIHNHLSRVSGLSDLSILSIKPIMAQISFLFRGNEERLRIALLQKQLSLGMARHNNAAKFTRGGRDLSKQIYDLTYLKGHVRMGKNPITKAESRSNSFYRGVKTESKNPAVRSNEDIQASDGTHTF